MKNNNILGLTVAALFTAGSAQAAVMEIDNFDGDVFSQSATPNFSGVSAGNSSAGFARTAEANSSGVATKLGLNSGASAGLYSHSQEAGVTGFSQINYALGGIDLDNGANAFRIGLDSIDLNGVFGVGVDGITVSLLSTDVLIDNGFSVPSFADILFSDFAGVNFDSVNTVSLFIDGSNQAALDATLDNFGTFCSSLTDSGGSGTDANGNAGNCTPPPPPPSNVPEPSSLALLGIGLTAFGFGRRRKKTK